MDGLGERGALRPVFLAVTCLAAFIAVGAVWKRAADRDKRARVAAEAGIEIAKIVMREACDTDAGVREFLALGAGDHAIPHEPDPIRSFRGLALPDGCSVRVRIRDISAEPETSATVVAVGSFGDATHTMQVRVVCAMGTRDSTSVAR